MIKRNKIIMTLVIVLVCVGVTFVILQKEGRSTASASAMSDTDVPEKRQTTNSDKGLVSELGTDSIYDRLSNNPSQGKDLLLFYKDSLIALSREVKDSTIHLDSSQQEKAELKYEVIE